MNITSPRLIAVAAVLLLALAGAGALIIGNGSEAKSAPTPIGVGALKQTGTPGAPIRTASPAAKPSTPPPPKNTLAIPDKSTGAACKEWSSNKDALELRGSVGLLATAANDGGSFRDGLDNYDDVVANLAAAQKLTADSANSPKVNTAGQKAFAKIATSISEMSKAVAKDDTKALLQSAIPDYLDGSKAILAVCGNSLL